MRTSILIPSYRRPRMLQGCLAHLNQQSVAVVFLLELVDAALNLSTPLQPTGFVGFRLRFEAFDFCGCTP